MDIKSVTKKWQDKWKTEKVFEADPDDRDKYFLTTPYPYVNAYPHIGHLLTYLRGDMQARFKRMLGFNVLYPQGWHATGSPIINAALRVKNKEEKQTKIMKDMGFSDEEIVKFEKPEYWIEHFVPEFRKDFERMGFSIDWRREFHTTSLNPHYDKFITWQFNTLKKKGYVGTGKHPVVWCKTCNSAVSDHSRTEGEGETPQEFTLLKFKFGDEFLIAATLRPETVFVQTNLWIKPNSEYTRAKVDGETWIASADFFSKIIEQEKEVEIIEALNSSDLIGKLVVAPMIDREVMILPSHFCDLSKGTGIVTSVPSDAPDDWMGLQDLQNSEKDCEKHGLDVNELKKIKPIPIIDSEGLGDLPAKTVCEDMKITNQHQREKLEKAKKLVYKKGFYAGVMKEGNGKYGGLSVEKAKDKVKNDMVEAGIADTFYELTGKVVCRCLTSSVVKIVSNQWFLYYGDEEWKKKAAKCVENMKFYPEKARSNFEHVVDWLKHWACSREQGLGTKLPWQKEWIIESLSDSTIYMAFYTIAHKIKGVDPEKLNDAFFDYVFLGEDVETELDESFVRELRDEFNYWYPMDYRNSGKDLIQNHLSFSIFNHTAIFPEDKWPRSFGVNGWITIDGQKMSKSLGNMIPLRDMAEQYGPDVSRITVLSGGESLDDPNWDSEFAKSQVNKLGQLYDFCVENYNKGSDKNRIIDDWMKSELMKNIRDTTDFMDKTFYRSALQKIYFDLQKKIRWYKRRTNDSFNKEVMNLVIESQVKMLAPFAPHICEEIWEKLGMEGFISNAKWVECDESLINEDLNVGEQLIEQTLSDISKVKELSKLDKLSKISLFVANDWKYELFEFIKGIIDDTPQNEMFKKVMSEEKFKQYGQQITKFLPKLIKAFPEFNEKSKEKEILNDAIDFLKSEFDAVVEIINADESEVLKAGQAMPGKPAILVE